jgi:hypothetical protein
MHETLHPAGYSRPAFLANFLVSFGMVLGFVRVTTMNFLEPTSASRRPASELHPPLTGGASRPSCPHATDAAPVIRLGR